MNVKKVTVTIVNYDEIQVKDKKELYSLRRGIINAFKTFSPVNSDVSVFIETEPKSKN